MTTAGATVATERTDVLRFGRLRLQFWVWGRFDVRGGRITMWRDSFDYLNLTRALVRGLAGVALPGLRPAPPTSPGAVPGRH
ncbi:MAG: limonene,2-epoxide hydrolase [Pseudonocardiales bacterium]|nr:limonene,2-epoxide hydrolase [Pseudonocardiales bacterium]